MVCIPKFALVIGRVVVRGKVVEAVTGCSGLYCFISAVFQCIEFFFDAGVCEDFGCFLW